MVAAFEDPVDAICFALAVQDRLSETHWPGEILAMHGCEPVYSNRYAGKRIYAGLTAGCMILNAEVCAPYLLPPLK